MRTNDSAFEMAQLLGALDRVGWQLVADCEKDESVNIDRVGTFNTLMEKIKENEYFCRFQYEIEMFAQNVVASVAEKRDMFDGNEEIVYYIEDTIDTILLEMKPVEMDFGLYRNEDKQWEFVGLHGMFYYGTNLMGELCKRVRHTEDAEDLYNGFMDYARYVMTCDAITNYHKGVFFDIMRDVTECYIKEEADDGVETDLREYVMAECRAILESYLADDFISKMK